MPTTSEHVKKMAPGVLESGVIAAQMLRATGMEDSDVVRMVITEALPGKEVEGMEAAYIESLKYLLGLAVVRLAKQSSALADLESKVDELFALARRKGVVE
jgi:hypothetical protein